MIKKFGKLVNNLKLVLLINSWFYCRQINERLYYSRQFFLFLKE